jgi:hypothetical protein
VISDKKNRLSFTHHLSLITHHLLRRRTIMQEYEGQGAGRAQEPEQEESPSEKLEGTPPEGSLVPGPENPESVEIKDEQSPNTE